MSNRKKKNGAKPQGDYEIGYGRPPRHTQFKKNVSGNYLGRPKRSMSLGEALEKQMRRSIVITDETGRKVVSMFDAMAMRLASDAVKGNTKIMRDIIAILSKQRAQKEAEDEARIDDMTDDERAWRIAAILEGARMRQVAAERAKRQSEGENEEDEGS